MLCKRYGTAKLSFLTTLMNLNINLDAFGTFCLSRGLIRWSTTKVLLSVKDKLTQIVVVHGNSIDFYFFIDRGTPASLHKMFWIIGDCLLIWTTEFYRESHIKGISLTDFLYNNCTLQVVLQSPSVQIFIKEIPLRDL